jgi:hypothetical protein
MATTLGGSTLADPIAGTEGCEKTAVGEGKFLTMADGSIRLQSTTTRYHFHLRWRGLTAAQVTTILTKYLVKTSQSFSPPEEAGSYTVLVCPGTWHQSSWPDSSATLHYDVEMQVEEVS